MYPTKKGGREWYVNMADPKNDPIFSTGFSQTLIKKIAVPMTDVTIIIIITVMVVVGLVLILGALLIHRLECMLILLQVLHNGKI
jgi:hypothetical protein